MALKSAEKQRRYRQQHLIHGNKERLQLFISAPTRAQLVRLAAYHNCTLTKLIEKLAVEADLAMFRQIPARQVDAYVKPSSSPVGTARIDAADNQRRARRGGGRLQSNPAQSPQGRRPESLPPAPVDQQGPPAGARRRTRASSIDYRDGLSPLTKTRQTDITAVTRRDGS